jgi:hypothetical protein
MTSFKWFGEQRVEYGKGFLAGTAHSTGTESWFGE